MQLACWGAWTQLATFLNISCEEWLPEKHGHVGFVGHGSSVFNLDKDLSYATNQFMQGCNSIGSGKWTNATLPWPTNPTCPCFSGSNSSQLMLRNVARWVQTPHHAKLITVNEGVSIEMETKKRLVWSKSPEQSWVWMCHSKAIHPWPGPVY